MSQGQPRERGRVQPGGPAASCLPPQKAQAAPQKPAAPNTPPLCLRLPIAPAPSPQPHCPSPIAPREARAGRHRCLEAGRAPEPSTDPAPARGHGRQPRRGGTGQLAGMHRAGLRLLCSPNPLEMRILRIPDSPSPKHTHNFFPIARRDGERGEFSRYFFSHLGG